MQEDFRGFAIRRADSPLFQYFCGLGEIDRVLVPAKSTLQRYAHWTDDATLAQTIHDLFSQAHVQSQGLRLAQPGTSSIYRIDYGGSTRQTNP